MKINILNKLYNFVIATSRKFNIDESHSISHSMNVYYYANKIYNDEISYIKECNYLNKELDILLSIEYKNIIDVSSILHDMCDKKYMDEKVGIENIETFIKTELNTELNEEITEKELDIIKKIISTMSYSTVKKNGFPNLGIYQCAYNIVREADLLASYDFERCIIYNMIRNEEDYLASLIDALKVFENRVFKYHDDNLFTTKYGLMESNRLRIDVLDKIDKLKNIIKIN